MTRTNTRTPRALRRIVAADPLLAAWDARRRRETELAEAVRSGLPRQLAMRIRVADAQREILELVADSGAVAAAVRQRLPDVAAQLARNGHEFTGIRVRVQVRAEPELAPKKPPNPMDAAATSSVARLADSLPPGPLRTSLERLARRGR